MTGSENPIIAGAASRPPIFAFIVQPEFPLNALILATEALRIANQNSGKQLFQWLIASEGGGTVRASNGQWITCDHGLLDLPRSDFVFVLEGNLPTQNISAAMLGALRSAYRHGSMIIGVDTGAFVLAAAGLTCERQVVLHWEAAPSYLEHYPEASLSEQIYLIDRQLAYCAGGVATLDLMLDLIGRLRGHALSHEVANALVHRPRDGGQPQRADAPTGDAQSDELSRRIVTLIEESLDFPLSPKTIAEKLGMSVRTLERFCQRKFNQTPKQLCLLLRLQSARNLLFYEEREIKDIALACGFSYPSVFTRAFKIQFGQSPRSFRQSLRERQSFALRPEIARLSSPK